MCDWRRPPKISGQEPWINILGPGDGNYGILELIEYNLF